MPIEFAEDLLENDDFRVETDSNGDLIQEHKQTGAQFKFDSNKNRWIPVQGLDLEDANIDNASFGTNVDAQGNDINNIGAVNTDELRTTPNGVLLTKNSDQPAGNGSLINPVEWESADEFNSEADDFANLSNNSIDIPNDEYSRARCTVSILMGSQVEFDFFTVTKNGNSPNGISSIEDLSDATGYSFTTAWVPVSSGDSFEVLFRQSSGGTVKILSDHATYFMVEAV